MREGWRETTLGEALSAIKLRAGANAHRILSVTEKRGIVPQEEVFAKRIATEDTSKYKVLAPLDIAYNPYLLWAGAVGQWRGNTTGVTSPVYECFRVSSPHNPRFVGLLLESGLLGSYFESTAIGSIPRRRRTPVAVFLDAPILLPPLDEQRRIVDLIAAVDEAIEATAVLSEELSNAGRVLTMDIERHIRNYEYVELGKVGEVKGGVAKDAKRQTDPEFVSVPYLRVANVQRGFLDLADISEIRVPAVRARELQLRHGDILLNEGGDRDKLGRGWIWEGRIPHCIHQNHVFRARITDERIDPYYVAVLTNSSIGQRWFEENGIQTTNLASINISTIRRFPIPLIPMESQLAIREF